MMSDTTIDPLWRITTCLDPHTLLAWARDRQRWANAPGGPARGMYLLGCIDAGQLAGAHHVCADDDVRTREIGTNLAKARGALESGEPDVAFFLIGAAVFWAATRDGELFGELLPDRRWR